MSNKCLTISFLIVKMVVYLRRKKLNFCDRDIKSTLSAVKSTEKGLSSQEAKERLEKNGANVLPQKKPKSKFLRFLEQFKDVMIILLLKKILLKEACP